MDVDPADVAHDDPKRIDRIMTEFVDSAKFLENLGPAVTVFGSARTAPSHPDYRTARELTHGLARHGLTIVTGGGPGIMEAANRGAAEAGGRSVGLLVDRQINAYVNCSFHFRYLFNRKVCLINCSRAFVCFPGGFGTLDEFFEILALTQSRRHPPCPIILLGTTYWKGLIRWFESDLENQGRLGVRDLELFRIAATAQKALDLILESWNSRPAPAGRINSGPGCEP